jgi:glycosyltransferase involved in cell wall biosynthesis
VTVVQLLTQATGGPCDHAVDVALELSSRGEDVLVVIGDGPAAERLDAAGVRRISFGPRSKTDLAGIRRLVEILRREAPDVLHCQDRRAGLIGRGASGAIKARRIVYTLHGVPDSMSSRVSGNIQVRPERFRDRLLYLQAERFLAHRGDPVIVPSRALAAYLIREVRLPPSQVHVVPNGVDTDRFKPGVRKRSDGTLDVFWLGAFVPAKRIDVLLRAVALVDGVALRLGGAGELERQHRALASSLGVADRVKWLGWVVDPADAMSTADVVALPSSAENLPLVLLQGMAAGAACVASRVGGVPELVTSGHDGLLVDPGDVAGLAAALRQLRDSAALRDTLGLEARRTVAAHYDLATTVDRLLKVYRA